MPPRVAHLTSVHPRWDTRIWIKQCRSLADAGYSVSLIVADGAGEIIRDGIAIYDVGSPGSRLDRMLNVTRRILDKAYDLAADLYHLHDPELLPVGVRLVRAGKKVIFDAHEDIGNQLLTKPYLGRRRRLAISRLYILYERAVCTRFHAIVAATPTIRDYYLRINKNTVDINNYPRVDELSFSAPWNDKQSEVCYVGRISVGRGIRETVTALGLLQSTARLNLCGTFSDLGLSSAVRSLPGWARVNEYGFVNRVDLREVLERSLGGLVTFHPHGNHINAQPNKMFEYMSAGIPVIASNFPLWRQIIEGNACGLCVDPLDPGALAKAIDTLVTRSDEAQRMGQNALQAVVEQYNWQREEEKLTKLYDRVLG